MTPLSALLQSPWLVYALAGCVLAMGTALVLLVVHYRRRLEALRAYTEQQAFIGHRFSAFLPDRPQTREAEPSPLRQDYEALQRTHAVLLARHQALIREFERRHAHGDGHASAHLPTASPTAS